MTELSFRERELLLKLSATWQKLRSIGLTRGTLNYRIDAGRLRSAGFVVSDFIGLNRSALHWKLTDAGIAERDRLLALSKGVGQ